MPTTKHEFFYNVLTLLVVTVGAFSTGIAASPKVAEVYEATWPLKDQVLDVAHHSWWLSPGTGLLAAGLLWTRRAVGPPWSKRVVVTLLESVRDQAFLNPMGDLNDFRVTLFKAVGPASFRGVRANPFGQRLVPVARTSHVGQRGIKVFRIPRMRPANGRAGSVAAQAWQQRSKVEVTNLPDVFSRPAKPADIAEYASKTFSDERWVHKERPRSRWICAWAVEVGDSRWGVIVLDSSEPLPRTGELDQIYLTTAKLMARVIERL